MYNLKDKNGNIIGTVNNFIAKDSQVKTALEQLINEGKLSSNTSSYFVTKNINLINPNTVTLNKRSMGNGTYGDYDGFNLTDFIEVTPGTYYSNIYSSNDTSFTIKIDRYGGSKKFISSSYLSEATKVIDGVNTKLGYGSTNIGSDVKYIRIVYMSSTSNPCFVKEKYGTNFSDYPYSKKEIDIDADYKTGFCDNLGNTLIQTMSDLIVDKANSVRPLYGKKWLQIGDSNTQYMGDDLGNAVIQQRGLGSFTNLGTAGATWEINSSGDAYSAVKKVDSLIANADATTHLCTDYDIVTIMMGTNCNSEGNITDTSSQTDTMCGAVRYCLEKLSYYYRTSAIGVILPPQRAENNSNQKQKNDKIKAICNEFSIPTLDLYNEGRIVPNSMIPDGTPYLLGDGLHLGANGKMHYYRIVGAWLETI